MKKREKNNYFSNIFASLKETKFDKKYWTTFFYDFILSVLMFGIISVFLYYCLSYVENVVGTYGEGFLSSGVYSPEVIKVILVLSAFLISFVVIKFLLSGIFKSVIWKELFGKRASFKFYFKYLLLKLLFLVILLIVFALGLVIFGPAFNTMTSDWGIRALTAIFLLILAYPVHISFLSLFYMTNSEEVWKSFKEGFVKGTKKIHYFLGMYAVIVILYLVYMLIDRGLRYVLLRGINVPDFSNLISILPQAVSYMKSTAPYFFISGVVLLFFYAYFRIFYVEFVKRI